MMISHFLRTRIAFHTEVWITKYLSNLFKTGIVKFIYVSGVKISSPLALATFFERAAINMI